MKENKQQNTAIHHTSGPCMVLAGPGSGKTTVITHRVMYLAGELEIPPEKILVITFTRAAADEMKERYRRLSGGKSGVSFGTFHSLFFKIIRYAYRYDASNILREDERNRYIREAADKLKIEGRDSTDFVMLASGEISRYKNRGEGEKFHSTLVEQDAFEGLYKEFCSRLATEGKLDFDDMMLKCLELFKTRRDILQYWQGCFEYVLVDEFQDICPLQYRLVRLLSQPDDNLFVVGDDDQSIYSFRGSEPKMCFQFERDYTNADGFEKIALGVNYRCAANIVDASARLISHNKNRYKKLLETGRGADGGSGLVRLRSFRCLEEQNGYIVSMVKMLEQEGIPLEDIAVLYRTNTQPRTLISLLRKENIPFDVRETIPNIYEHWISRNIMAYLETAEEFSGAGDRDDTVKISRDSLLSIINRPKRYISRESFRREDICLKDLYQDNCAKAYVTEKLDKLKYDLGIIARLDPFAGIRYIRKAVGYEGYLKEYAADRQTDCDSLLEILDELEASAKEHGSLSSWKQYIADYTDALRRVSNSKERPENTGVRLLTFHSAKGLEFDTVFIIDVNEDFMPYWQAETTAEIEEERRMFYVAVTRAKNRLFLLYSAERFGREYDPSRFIYEMGMEIRPEIVPERP